MIPYGQPLYLSASTNLQPSEATTSSSEATTQQTHHCLDSGSKLDPQLPGETT